MNDADAGPEGFESVKKERASKPPPRYFRWFIFAALALQFVFVYFHRVSIAVVAPELIGAFQISGAAMGVLAAGYFYTYAFMQLPVGLLVDSWGPRKTISAFSLIAALGAILFGASNSFGVATFSRILVGLGLSTVFVASLKVFTYWFHGREYARVSGMFLAVGGIGWLMAASPLAVLSKWLGWRAVFISIGIATLVITAITYAVVRDRPREDAGGGGTIPEKTGGRVTLWRNVRRVLGEKYFWPLALWNFTNGGILFGFFGLWAGPYLMEDRGFPKTLAGNILSVVSLAMIFGSPVLGYITDKVIKSRKAILLCSSVTHLVCWIILLLFHRNVPAFALYPLFFVMGITSCAIPVVLLTATRELFPQEIAGAGQGIMNLFPFVGSMAFQPLLGLILDKTRAADGRYLYENAFWFLLIACAGGIVSLLFMKGKAGEGTDDGQGALS